MYFSYSPSSLQLRIGTYGVSSNKCETKHNKRFSRLASAHGSDDVTLQRNHNTSVRNAQ